MLPLREILYPITPEILLRAYELGLFPMAESAEDDELFWVEPVMRGILPLDEFHLPRRLARTIRQEIFQIRIDTDFQAVIEGCAGHGVLGRQSTWINAKIRALYSELFDMGYCHTVEVWREDRLVGGLYGVALGGAFFGESMFSRERDASKVALVYLVARLKYGGFQLLDTQFVTDHLRQFGAKEIPREVYLRRLGRILRRRGDFFRLPKDFTTTGILQLVSQTSNTGCSTG